MDTQWLDSSGARLQQLGQVLATGLHDLADPARLRLVRQALYLLAAIWLVFALASLVWSLLPQPEPAPVPGNILNPLLQPGQQAAQAEVDIQALADWNLFGTAASIPTAVVAAPEETLNASGLDGIENNAKETRLSLTLQGIVASSDANLARAIIEAKREQQQYAVGDELPVSGKVTLAKIMSDRVVLNNGGRYELLLLFDENGMAATRPSTPERKVATVPKATMDKRGRRDVSQMAESYRRRLYSNPQSLAQVVKIAAVREGGRLQGYRVSAGKDRDQFAALGFQANDVVTGVNGIELSDPGKAMELYRVMRNANEASFEVLRDGEAVTLVVGLEGAAQAAGAQNLPQQPASGASSGDTQR
ncbi:MAG: type II secretion system protein GspC [Halieaceae bacterium]